MSTDQDQIIDKSYDCIFVPKQFFFKVRQMFQWIFTFFTVEILEFLSFDDNDWLWTLSAKNCIITILTYFFDKSLISFLCKNNINVLFIHSI